MRYVSGTLAILLLLVVVVFSLQNREPVSLAFLVWSLSIPKVFLILGTYVLGMLSGWGLVALLKRLF
jgi:lipopolysaccharide assembly protein A